MLSLRELLLAPGAGEYPPTIRPYTPPLTRSIAAPPGSKLLPSRSGGSLKPIEGAAQHSVPTEWTPWGVKSLDPLGYRLSSGPQAEQGGQPRTAYGVAYAMLDALWNLSGVASGWSRPYGANPGRKPTTAFALGNWTPFPGGTRPLPSNPAPAQMLTPGF